MLVLAAQLNPTIGDIPGNLAKILAALEKGQKAKVDIVLYPELSLCGYFPDDLLLDFRMIEACQEALLVIAPQTKGMFVVVGLPRKNPSGVEKPLLNSAAIFIDGKFQGFKDKTLLPTYDVFDEKRYFEPGEKEAVWEYKGRLIAVTICEDAWKFAYRKDPIQDLVKKKPDLLLNLSGSPYHFKKIDERLKVFGLAAKALQCPVVFCNQVGGNDQLLFDGYSFHLNERAELVSMAKGFIEDLYVIDLSRKVLSQARCSGMKDLYSALILGVRDYFYKQGFQKALLGLSGGVDSALVACIAKEALGSHNVHALMMPSRYSSKGSLQDSEELAKKLNIKLSEVPIDPIFHEYLATLRPNFQNLPENEAEENLQSRIRGMILMAFSNKFGAIVLNTGNKSEMAMGYTTLYGDMVGGLGVLHDVTKTKVFELARLTQVIPQSILDKPPSAELKQNQLDTDTLPPYAILDPILEDYLEEELSIEEIAKRRKHPLDFIRSIVRRIHAAEFKRRQAPISLRVTPKALNKGRIVPIVQKWQTPGKDVLNRWEF